MPSLTNLTNSLGADVLLNNTANYFDGPSVAQGTTGTWFASGTVTVQDTVAANIFCKLWDGTTIISSTAVGDTATFFISLALSGVITSPAGNLRISCREAIFNPCPDLRSISRDGSMHWRIPCEYPLWQSFW